MTSESKEPKENPKDVPGQVKLKPLEEDPGKPVKAPKIKNPIVDTPKITAVAQKAIKAASEANKAMTEDKPKEAEQAEPEKPVSSPKASKADERRQFISRIMDKAHADLLGTVDDLPDEWNESYLREYIVTYFNEYVARKIPHAIKQKLQRDRTKYPIM